MKTPTIGTLQRMGGPLAAGLVLASLIAPHAGCGERLRRDADKGQSSETPAVNAGLNKIAKDDAPVLAGEQPEDDFSDTRQKVIESASMLESYFSTAENELGAMGESKKQQIVQRVDPVDEEQHASGDSVRVSLADAASEQTQFTQNDERDTSEQADTTLTKPLENKAETSIRVASAEGEAGAVALPTSPEERKEQLVDELIGVLTELAQSADDPGSSAMALAGLETLRADTLESLMDQGLLSDAEKASLEAVRSMLRSIVGDEDGGGTIASPSEVSTMLTRIQRELNAEAGLAINDAKLCISVSGYGQYEQFPSNRFVAGRTHRAIVYVEMDRFTQREMTGPDGDARYEVKLSQRLELYHIADDLNTWNRSAETDTTISRNRLRDYYLINQITLPPNLGVGRYNLKVVMRDLIANQVVEAIIPIEIVAG